MEESARKVDRKIKTVAAAAGKRGKGIIKIDFTQRRIKVRNTEKFVRILSDYRTKEKHNWEKAGKIDIQCNTQ